MMIYCAMLSSEEDQNQFSQLYYAYRGVMFHTAMGILNNAKDSEDVVHQSFLKIIEHFEQIKSPVSPATRAFVLLITQRTAIDLYRRYQKSRAIPLDEAMIDQRSAAAIAKLPSRYRDILLMKFDTKLSNQEIASILSTSEANVRKLIQRAKERLSKNLEEQGVSL